MHLRSEKVSFMSKDSIFKVIAASLIFAGSYSVHKWAVAASFQDGCKKGAQSVFGMMGYQMEEKALVEGCANIAKLP